MSITRKQQDIIDDAILSYIHNFDKTASQYIKLRQDIYLASTEYAKLKTSESEPTQTQLEQQQLTLAKLKYELDRVSESYKVHLRYIQQNLSIRSNIDPPYSRQLQIEFDQLENKRDELRNHIKELKETQKPLVDSVTALTTTFQKEIRSKSAKAKLFAGTKNLGKDTDATKLDLASSVFEYDELKNLFEEMNDLERKSNNEEELSFDVVNYLKDHIQANRAYHKFDGEKYLYDISRTNKDAGATSVENYDVMIDNLKSSIKDLIEHGTEAKQRWSTNAKKIELIRALLEDEMEVN